MDELLEVADVVANSGLEGVVTWIPRLLGLVAVLAGADLDRRGAALVLIVVGILLLAIPGILLELSEVAG